MFLNLGNILNDGLVYNDGDSIYYSNISSDYGKLYSQSLALDNKQKLSDIKDVKYINKFNSYIYYVSKYSIYKLDLYTKKNEVVFSTENEFAYIDEMIIIGDEMFFSVGSEDTTTYKMNLKTLHIKEIIKNTFGINIKNNKLYYSLNIGSGIYTLNLDDYTVTKLIDSKTSYPLIKNNYLYYFNSEEKAFFKINLDEQNLKKEKIIDINKNIEYFNIISNNIIYEDFYLFKLDLKSKQIEKLNDLQSDLINCVNNEVWFRAYKNNEFKFYRMNLEENSLNLVE